MDTKLSLLVTLLLPLVSSMKSPSVWDSDEMCAEGSTSCSFHWMVKNQQTMMFYDEVLASPVIYKNGTFYARKHCSDTTQDVELTPAQLKTVFTSDGSYKYIQTINHMFPGPTVVVYEGQEIEIKVQNLFWQQGTGVHWHGIIQHKSNWMDGVPGVTQCSINPQETFTYRFKAEPAGTHWYHSHQGLQRGDGYYGAFIVLPRGYKNASASANASPKMAANGDPIFHRDYIMMVSDWFPGESNLAMTSFMNDLKQFMFDGWNKTGYCYGGSKKAPNGVSAATFRYNSVLFNGKGYLYDANMNPTVPVPLETYVVKQNEYVRFRVINAASAYAFMISVDDHRLTVISSDGQDIEPIETDYVIVHAGERFDFYIYTNRTVSNYWIRSTTLEYEPHEAHAIVRYEGAPATNPTTSTPQCSNGCDVVNCPFPTFIRGPFMKANCINFESIKSRTNSQITVDMAKYEEHFIAWEKTDSPYKRKYDTCNGVMFRPPSTPPTVVGTVKYDLNCANMGCGNQACDCTNQIQLGLNNVVQLVLLANTTHPIHLHGHYFEVIKMGYAPPGFDNVTYKSLMSNGDIKCNNAFCNKAMWSDSTWNNNNVPGTNLVNPPRKDTINIPAYGYVVVRFRADNPGWWMMHCHIETHMLQGMAIILQSGQDNQMNPPPPGFPTCGTYHLTQKQFQDALNNNLGQKPPGKPAATTPKPSSDSWTTREKNLAYGYIGVAIGGIILGIIIHICFNNCRKDD